ncbi:MAG: hypothetical protein U0Z17_09645 [Bacteroidales bacterium]
MERLIYKEEQSFRNSFMLWILLAAILVMISGFGIGFYQQFYLHNPYGDKPMSDNGLLWSGVITTVVVGVIFAMLMGGVLVTEIWSDGIRYKFPPLIRKMRFIPLRDIASAEVGKYRPLLEFGGWGWRKRLLQRKTAYNVSGSIGIRITLKNGSQILLGTLKQEEMKRAVDKMMKPDTNKYPI